MNQMMTTLELNINTDALIDGAKEKFQELIEYEEPTSLQHLKAMFAEAWEDLVFDHISYSITNEPANGEPS